VSLPADRIYLFDTSIWDYTEHPLVAPDWEAALRNNQLAVSPIVVFEVLYIARNQADFEALERQLDALRQAPLTQGIVRDARRALHTLSAKANHRLPFQDVLIAATAAHKSAGVLHYDGHFDTLSTVLDFESRCCEHERRRRDRLIDGGPADCGAVEAMKVVWPFSVGLRGQALNRPHLHWLKTVVENVVGKGATRSRQVWIGEMSDGRKSSAVDVSKLEKMTSKPGPQRSPGKSLEVTRLLSRRRPAYRQHDPDRGSSMERVKVHPETAAGRLAARGRTPSGRIREEQSTVAGCAGGLARSSCEPSAYRSGSGAKGRGCPGSWVRSTERKEARA
jgi:predicted nucleic acid-binding protein